MYVYLLFFHSTYPDPRGEHYITDRLTDIFLFACHSCRLILAGRRRWSEENPVDGISHHERHI